MSDSHIPNTYIKYDPLDENIFCPLTYIDGSSGHGLLKKYYIPSLKKTICDYCEIHYDEESKTLCYFQGKRDCKHLIKDFGEWREELFKVQSICKEADNNEILLKEIFQTKNYTEVPIRLSKEYEELFKKFNQILEENLLPFINQIEDVKKVKDMISQIKFDSQGKVNLTGIGNYPDLESKLIWLSLFLINMKSKNTMGNKNFDLTDDLIIIARQIVKTLYEECLATFDFLKYFCNYLLPELSTLEGQKINITYEDLMRDFKLSNNDDKIKELNLKISEQKSKIIELESRFKDIDNLNKDIQKYKDLYFREMEKSSTLNALIEKNVNKIEELNLLNESLKNKYSDLEKKIQGLEREKGEIKNYYEKLLLENASKNNEKFRQDEIYLKEKDLIISAQRAEIDSIMENDRKFRDRIYELELHLLKDKEVKKSLELKIEKVSTDYNSLLKRHELFNVFANETKGILNG